MSNVLVNKDKIDILANAISNKSGEPLTLTLDEMVEAVDGIETSGGGITPTGNINITQAGTTDVTNYATATVPETTAYVTAGDAEFYTSGASRRWRIYGKAIIDPGDSYDAGWLGETKVGGYGYNTDAVPSGTTITPTTSSQTIGGANYMMEGAVTVSAMPSGTAGTPTATKGSVSNHSVSVTPSVTNTTGYITGSTKTGTAVTVSASELVSGNLPITQNGNNIDCANYSTVSVNVSGSSKNTQVVQSTTRTNASSLTAIGAELTVSKTGTYDIYYSCFRTNTSSSYTWATRLYINGAAYGTAENTTWTNNQQNTHLSNISLTVGDKLRVYGRNTRGTSYYICAPTLVIVEA